jgi:hypothetical protein
MNIVELLEQYKISLINLGKSYEEKSFLEDSFSRWYFNVPKHNIIPKNNLVITTDLEYANKNKKCKFNINLILYISDKLFKETIFKINKLKNERYINQDNLISTSQLEHLHKLYCGKKFEEDKNKLIALYNLIGANGIHLSIPPIFTGIELFGSPLNTHNLYCSPFEIEKKFSSLGSFFNFNIAKSKESIFTCNPPFDEELMNKMVIHLEKNLIASKSPKTIIITIPVWDSESQKKIGIRDYGLDFSPYTKLMSSKFLIEHDILDRALYPYWDYYQQKILAVSYTHLIILAVGKPAYTIENIKLQWSDFIHKN